MRCPLVNNFQHKHKYLFKLFYCFFCFRETQEITAQLLSVLGSIAWATDACPHTPSYIRLVVIPSLNELLARQFWTATRQCVDITLLFAFRQLVLPHRVLRSIFAGTRRPCVLDQTTVFTTWNIRRVPRSHRKAVQYENSVKCDTNPL